MSGISRFSLKNGVAVVILCVLVFGYGLYSTTQIKQQTFPDISFPAVFIQAQYPGASTEEVETEVTAPVEQSLLNIKGYDTLTSTSAENFATISLNFAFGTDMDAMTKEVESAIAKLNLPSKAKVTVKRFSAGSQPIYEAAIFSADNKNAGDLQKVLENDVVPKLSKITGVSAVNLKGTKSEELHIEVDKDKASQHGISLQTIQSAIQGLDYALPLGSIDQDSTTIPIRLVGQINSIQQLKDLPLPGVGGSAPNGAGPARGATAAQSLLTPQAISAAPKVKLSEIANVTLVAKQNEITRFNGKESYMIHILKSQEANTAEVANKVKDALAQYKTQANLDIHVVMDQGAEIEKSVSDLIREGLFGILFCIIIIFLFLRNVRATLISILSLPISIFATIALLDQMGYTLNIMTLGGIAVSIGRIVDDSIVIIENIYRWRQEKGAEFKGKELAFRATKEVIGAVSSSTIATVVVFLPLAFVSGIIGEFFRPFAIAVVSSIIASLFVAMMLIPVLGARFFNNVKPHKTDGKMITAYEKFIRGALHRKKTVLSLSIVLLIVSLGTIPLLGLSFIPAGTTPTSSIELTLPAKSSIDETNALAVKVENYAKNLTGAINYQVSIGGSADNPFRGSSGETNKATLNVQFDKATNMNTIVDKANIELKPIVEGAVAGTTVNVKAGEQQGPQSGNGIDVSLYSSNLEDLSKAATQVNDLMKQNSQLKDITNNLKDVTPKWVLSLNQSGKDANVSSFQILQAVNEQLRPVDVGTYTMDKQAWNITMSYQQQISSKEQLEGITIQTAGGVKKLKDLVDVTESNAPVTINHDGGKTYAKISATVKGDDTTSVSRKVQADIKSLALPEGVDVSFGGGLEMITSGFKSLGIAMATAIFLVFLVMSLTFGGLLTPMIILSSLLFVPIGSLGALLITGQSLSMSAMIGMLMLVGIVVTNAVVLLDRVEKNWKSGMPMIEAIVEGSKTRVRPILMTASATILALVPLALSTSSSGLISGGLAITVIGGLFTSTLLTLVVVPVIYLMTGKRRKITEETI
jgi:HAE1 family hydrophobic/amphiphilic exporter-1